MLLGSFARLPGDEGNEASRGSSPERRLGSVMGLSILHRAVGPGVVEAPRTLQLAGWQTTLGGGREGAGCNTSAGPLQRGRQLISRRDLELAIGAGQVRFDGAAGHEQ